MSKKSASSSEENILCHVDAFAASISLLTTALLCLTLLTSDFLFHWRGLRTPGRLNTN